MDKIILSVENLSVFIDDYEILRSINLQINNGDFIFLKGPNGSGKTTFLDVLSCLNREGKYAIKGSISFNGENILNANYSGSYLKQRHYIEQVEYDFGMHVEDKIKTTMKSIPSYEFSINDIFSFIEKYKINEYFPGKNMKDIIKSKTKNLSEGQRKIISLLSGFMRSQYMKILIADEPLNHLDSSNIKKTIDLFTKFRSDFPELAVIITTHCQAFPEPTKYWLLKDKQIIPSPVPYHYYDCFSYN
jgi:ABC-type multidrug transport system ATPase subunit